MRVFSIQETKRGIDGVANVSNRGTFLKYEEAKEFFTKLVDSAEAQDFLFHQAIDDRGFVSLGQDHVSWGTRDGRFHQFDIIKSTISIPTTFEELSEANVSSRQTQSAKFKSPFENRLDKQVNCVWSRRQVPGSKTRANVDMLYNSGEFIIVFQCDDPSRTVATSVPFDASSYNNITTAINNIIKEEY